jgi:signal transduction histidine kinase
MGAQQLLRTPATQLHAIHEQAAVLARGTDRIHRIVDAILLLSSLQRGRLKLAFEVVDLAALLGEAADEAARATGRTIRVRTEPGLVRGDRDRLKHVLAQIIDNAIKYSPGGEAVDASMARTESDVLVRVLDHGVGIPREKQEYMFQRFFRAHADTPYDLGGMGVGLYLSQEIAREHGGRIWFESREGAGSTFHLELPCLPIREGSAPPE